MGAPTSLPLRAAFPHLSHTPPRPRRDPRSEARRSHAHRRPSPRESPHPSGRAPLGGGRRRDRCPAGSGSRAPTAALEAPSAPAGRRWSRAARSFARSGRAGLRCERGAASPPRRPPEPAQRGRERRRSPPRGSLLPSAFPRSLPLCIAGPPPPLRVSRYLRVRTAAARPRRPGAPAARSDPLRRSLPLGAASSAGRRAAPPTAPDRRAFLLSLLPSLSLCLSLLLSLSLPPAPGAAGKMPTHARPRPLPPRPDRPRPLPALRVRSELHGDLRIDSGVGSPWGELQPVLGPKGVFLVLFSFFLFRAPPTPPPPPETIWLLPDIDSSAGNCVPQTRTKALMAKLSNTIIHSCQINFGEGKVHLMR